MLLPTSRVPPTPCDPRGALRSASLLLHSPPRTHTQPPNLGCLLALAAVGHPRWLLVFDALCVVFEARSGQCALSRRCACRCVTPRDVIGGSECHVSKRSEVRQRALRAVPFCLTDVTAGVQHLRQQTVTAISDHGDTTRADAHTDSDARRTRYSFASGSSTATAGAFTGTTTLSSQAYH